MNECIYYGPQVLEVQEELQPCYDNTLYILTTMNCSINKQLVAVNVTVVSVHSLLGGHKHLRVPPPTPLWLVCTSVCD